MPVDEPRDLHADRIPGAERATIDSRKLTVFLLSPSHPKGRERARFFARLGYTRENWEELRDLILAELPRVAGRRRRTTRWGKEWEAIVRIEGSGYEAALVAGWQKRDPDDSPRFLTAYPYRS